MMRPLLLLLLFPFAAAAQTGKLAGHVVDDLGDSVPDANVIIEGTWLGVSADIDGEYVIADVPAGAHEATASLVQVTAVAEIRVQPDRTTQLNFFLPVTVFSSRETCKPDSSYRTEDWAWQNRMLPWLHAIAEDHGLALLQEQPTGDKEARLWLSLDGRGPIFLVRIVPSEAGVDGSLRLAEPLQLWDGENRVEADTQLRAFREMWSHRCGPVQNGNYATTCILSLTDTRGWKLLAHRFEDASLWTLPDETALPDLYGHCGGPRLIQGAQSLLTVELFEGASYRAYHYGDPSADSPNYSTVRVT